MGSYWSRHWKINHPNTEPWGFIKVNTIDNSESEITLDEWEQWKKHHKTLKTLFEAPYKELLIIKNPKSNEPWMQEAIGMSDIKTPVLLDSP